MYVGSRQGTKPGLAPPAPETGPHYLGRYRLVERVGAGGMAEIFRAVAEGPHGFERTVAVKRMLEHVAALPEVGKLFADEARISALLDHPNIVQIFDFGAVDGTYFIAMEFLKGRNLDEILYALRKRRDQLEPAAAIYIAREVARGLAYAHGLCDDGGRCYDIVHRDVSPANVMLLQTGGVKVLDFGIARVKSELRLAVTQGRALRGKCPYLAPEQITGAPPVDARSDLFALGAMLWEMLAGQRLFTGETELDIIGSVLHREIPPPSAHAPGIPAALDRIVLTALARDPELRYPSAEAMAADLDGVMRALPNREGTSEPPQMLAALLEQLFQHRMPRVATPTQPQVETPLARPQDLVTRPARFTYPADVAALTLGPPGISEAPTHRVVLPTPTDPDMTRETPPAPRLRDRRALAVLIGGLACLPMVFTMIAFQRRHPLAMSASMTPTTTATMAPPAALARSLCKPAPAREPEPGLYCAPAVNRSPRPTKRRFGSRSARALALGRESRPAQRRATDLHVDPFAD